MSDSDSLHTESEREHEDDIVDAKGESPAAEMFRGIRKKSIAEVGPLLNETYHLGYPRLAKPIIFNHENYSHFKDQDFIPSTRKGTCQDVQLLKEVFGNLNCDEPEVYDDLTAGMIQERLSKVSQQNFSHYACIIIVVLTHGEENQLYAKDEMYETSKLWEPFTKTSEPNLTTAGKPKLFFIQACRGEILDEPQDVVDAKGVSYQLQKVPLKKIPRCADFFIAHSSFLGYMSVRNELYGSWFIQTVCKAINKYKHQLDLMTIMTIVKNDIAVTRFYRQEKKQIPCTETTLTKTLFLTQEAFIKSSTAQSAANKPDVTDSRQSESTHQWSTLSQPVPQSASLDHRGLIGIFLVTMGTVLLTFIIALFLNGPVQCNCNCNTPLPPPM